MRAITLLGLSVLLLCSIAATAAVPQTMSYQGVLRDDAGQIVADSTYEITFWIYNVETGGMALWADTQLVPVTDGVFNVVLGSDTPLDLPFDEQYWLAITVEGEPQLAPRTALTSAPYAYRAIYSDIADDGDWSVSGDDVYIPNGSVGVGTASPQYGVDISRDENDRVGVRIRNTDTGSGSQEGVFFDNEDGGVAGLSVTDDDSVYGPLMNLYNNRPSGLMQFSTNGAARMRIDPNGRVGIGIEWPSQLLEVAGTAKIDGFQMTTGAATGYVLTSDASGVGAWSPAQGVSDGDWTVSGDDVYRSGGSVGIGTSTPTYDVGIRRDENALVGVRITNTDTGSSSREGILFSDEDGDVAGLTVADNTSFFGGASMMLYNNRPTGFIQFNTAGLERARITNSGYVGIGTSNPMDKLQINGNLRLDQGTGNGNIIRFVEGGVMKWAFLYRPWVNGNLTILDEVSTVRSMTFESGTGDVGVKTEHPETDLHVLGDTKLEGDVEITGEVTLAPVTSYYTVPASGFGAVYPTDTNYVIGGGVFTTDGGSCQFLAPVNLPHGATVTAVTHHYEDYSSSDSTCTLRRRTLSGYGGDAMADVPSTGTPGSGASTTDANIVGAVIDNTTYTYFVDLIAVDGIVTFGVVIEYTTTAIH